MSWRDDISPADQDTPRYRGPVDLVDIDPERDAELADAEVTEAYMKAQGAGWGS